MRADVLRILAKAADLAVDSPVRPSAAPGRGSGGPTVRSAAASSCWGSRQRGTRRHGVSPEGLDVPLARDHNVTVTSLRLEGSDDCGTVRDTRGVGCRGGTALA